MAPMWKKWMRNVDQDEQTSFLDHVYLECTETRMQKEQQRRRRVPKCQDPNQIGGRYNLAYTYVIGMSRCLDSIATIEVAKSFAKQSRTFGSSERNSYGQLLAGLVWERQFDNVLQENGWERARQIVNVFSCIVSMASSCDVYVDIIMAVKKHNLELMVEKK